MPYNNLISRTDAAALIPEDVAADVIKGAVQQSAALRMFRRTTLSRAQQRVPVLSVLPTAYFVNGDTGLKQTSEVNWANKFLNVEELAVIIPVPEAVIDDSAFDIWGESRPLMEEAVGVALDAAIFFGVNAPASWPTNVNAAAAAAGNAVNKGAAAAAGGYQDDVDQVFGAVEADGFDVTGIVARRAVRGLFRRTRDTTGQRLDGLNADLSEYLGQPIAYTMSGIWPTGGGANTNVDLFAGQWDQFIIGVRQDMTFKLFTEGVIQDNTGAIQYNLLQQDMVAMRLVFRVAWQVANVINREQQVEANRYPAGVLRY